MDERRVLTALAVCVALVGLLPGSWALSCVQCDRHGVWYSPEETERHVARCQSGLIDPTPCTNASHTHCIYSYYRQGVSSTVTITERRCGVAEDVLGCTLYKSSRKRFKRHFLNTEALPSLRRRDANALFVEVCTEGCQDDGCLNTASRLGVLGALFASTFVLYLTGFL